MIKIAVFASGSGSNAENIIRHFKENNDIKVSLVISNKPDAFVHERAKKLKIPSYTFNKSGFENGEVLVLLEKEKIDFIVLAGFLLKIPAIILKAYNHHIINIHPALLPKFGGKGMYGMYVHEAVVAAGETESGITIHRVNENYDEGQVIFQECFKIEPQDTPETVAEKVHALEYKYFPQVIEEEIRHIFINLK